MRLSLIIPAYNEKSVIADTVIQTIEYLEKTVIDYELLIVDDGSTDNMRDELDALLSEKVRLLSYGKNRGKGYAVRYGVLYAKGDYIMFTDADLAYGLKPIAQCLDMLKNGAPIVVGTRKTNGDGYNDYPLIRKIASKGFSFLTDAVLKLPYDTQCGFKGFEKKAGKSIFKKCKIDGFAFDIEVLLIAVKQGYKIKELPVSIINHRDSKVNVVFDSMRMLWNIIKIKTSIRRRVKEL